MPEASDSRRIDVHTHILPKSWPDLREKYGYGAFVQLEHIDECSARMLRDGKFFRRVTDNLWDPERRIDEFVAQNIAAQVISTVPIMFSYWAQPEHALDLAQLLNDHIAEVVAQHPDRFIGLATLPMQNPDLACRELERAVRELGLAGIEIATHVNHWNLDDLEVFQVLAAAEELDAAVFVHPWDMMGAERMERYWLQWLVGMPAETSHAICSMIFGGVFDRLPNLRVCFAHGGGSFPGTLGRIQHGYLVRPDLCAVSGNASPREYLGKFFVDTLVHDARDLDNLVALFGDDCVVLGSDYPFPLGESPPGAVLETLEGLDAGELARIGYHNAVRFLGTDVSGERPA